MIEKSSLSDGVYNSGKENTLEDSIEASKDNVLVISRLTKMLNYDGKCLLEEPHPILHRYKNTLMQDRIWFTIEDRMKFRPDAISEAYYGTPDLWYLVMWANEAREPLELSERAVQVIPMKTLTRVVTLALAAQEEVNENHANIPLAKSSTLVQI